MGLVLAYMYEKRRSLVPCIAAHVFFNTAHVVAFVYMNDFLRLSYSVEPRTYVGIAFLVFVGIYMVISYVELEMKISKESQGEKFA